MVIQSIKQNTGLTILVAGLRTVYWAWYGYQFLKHIIIKVL
ncbi:hypothetical protein SALWKB29_0778 [Snodgrassella communis]|uniref:Uncharacterized protein n=1 Tax=Snodgrassella communis TaxID=2946699 RepID=A0A836MS91_9NEIS|nr:hypothetical protein SALWKB29_0778 [Snodgrassella communis]